MKTLTEQAQEYCDRQNAVTRSEFNAFIDGAQAAQEWISVKDELPEVDVYVLCKIQGVPLIGSGLYVRECKEVTHWRPIERR